MRQETKMQTDIQFIPCHTFGGGWLVPRTPYGLGACGGVMGEDPAFLTPIGEEGYAIDPQNVDDIVTTLRAAGATVELENGDEGCATCAASIETRILPCDECGALDEEAKHPDSGRCSSCDCILTSYEEGPRCASCESQN